MAKALFQTGMTGINGIGGGNANGTKAAITLASAILSLDDRIALINSLNVYAEMHAKDVGSAVERARITTALALAAGPIAELSPAVAACMANLVCRNEAAIAVGEMLAGEALGGGTLAVGGGAATKQVVNTLEEVAAGTQLSNGLDDIISKGTRRTADEVNATFPNGYSYTPATQVVEYVADGRQTFVRVVSGPNSCRAVDHEEI
ncbi:hypothetical protein [Ensifer adhaerens]|uniref:hypothetical protein n=1 Tax=Ensifer adhaerens TaxID=106592 RepID=UPI00098EC3D3|nr:hypothetical protein [Ensifer adhaerens]